MRRLRLAGDGPHKGGHFSRNCHHDLIDVCASGHQASVASTEADLRFPTYILNRRGYVFQPQLEVPADLGRVAIRPRPFDQDPAGMGVTRFRNRALPATLATGVFTGGEAQITYELTGSREAREIPSLSNQGDGGGELHAAQSSKMCNANK
jgi:hypothetical protein